ncbi:YugN-like family protein [Halobacillus yeomjeoni]|uniref:YugN-like family protein n=1 Tax=Halobacillus yeomjeoni TaxID=311194 RepID=A0A931HX74_9BACI|nr:YugN-like family protein [Halobacillus yeomjeoni]MBH0231066.1 YugN-like family protein [Halobacillus yeomjeoni]
MISLSSSITGGVYTFNDVEQELKPIGFKLSDSWDYEHGYFDYKIADEVGYQFLRLPFVIKSGSLDAPADYATIEMKEPFLLSHKYNPGLDDNVREGNIRAIFDQFQEPVDKDATFPEEYISTGREVLAQVEQVLMPKRSE